ncbi:transcription factor RAX3-like [Chenopodium quinoa]|uniref:Uncharacterized protein n=1 Tax=Chenopodium quinoa TaxID=63459 RepID=A0A803N2I6_CHEQI|nr:transcription factor RAX3-like [Chenopodium quinoa]
MGRAPCCDKANVKKGPWSPEEDAKLKSYIERNGTGGNWIALPQKIGLKRCGKSCRLRWLNYLRPNIKHGGFSEEEDRIILSLYVSIGSRWSIIAAQLPGRTDNDIKNYWNTRLKTKLLGKQRRDQQQVRKANNLIIKQEDHRLVDSIPITSSFVNHNQIPYWPPQLTTNLTSAISIPNYSNSSCENYQGLNNDHTSLRKLLMKVNGGHYDSVNNNPQLIPIHNITYPNNITQTNINLSNSTLPLDTMIRTCELTNNSTNFNHQGELEGVRIGMMEGQSSTFPPELEELMSSNPQRVVAEDGLEFLYGDYGNSFVNNDGSTSDTTTCGESSGWVKMSSLVTLPNLESDCSVLVQEFGEENRFEEPLRYSSTNGL